MIPEQRTQDRFIAKENAYVALGRKFTKVGKMKDISLAGLAFEYISGEELNEDSSELDIFIVGTEFHLYKIPCKLIYNIEVHVPKINNKLVKVYTTKRCGVKLEKITNDLKALLKFFIKYHTRGRVVSKI